MGIHFLTPLAAVVAVVAALPILGAAVRERRDGRARIAIALPAPRFALRAETAVYSVAAVLALAAAASQPALSLTRPVLARRDSQAYLLFDTSRSMLARRSPTSPTRFDRAVALGLRMRDALADVAVGAGSMTDRPLPHLLPSYDAQSFASVVHEALGIDRPPPGHRAHRATDFSTLTDIPTAAWFTPDSKHRLVVLFTDGESGPFSVSSVEQAFDRARIRLIVVHVSRPGEAIFRRDGSRDPGYQADPQGGDLTGLEVFAESRLGSATRAARSVVEQGPRIQAGRTDRTVPLGRYAVLAAALPIALLLFRRR